jgi:hypothetical protein
MVTLAEDPPEEVSRAEALADWFGDAASLAVTGQVGMPVREPLLAAIIGLALLAGAVGSAGFSTATGSLLACGIGLVALTFLMAGRKK